MISFQCSPATCNQQYTSARDVQKANAPVTWPKGSRPFDATNPTVKSGIV